MTSIPSRGNRAAKAACFYLLTILKRELHGHDKEECDQSGPCGRMRDWPWPSRQHRRKCGVVTNGPRVDARRSHRVRSAQQRGKRDITTACWRPARVSGRPGCAGNAGRSPTRSCARTALRASPSMSRRRARATVRWPARNRPYRMTGGSIRYDELTRAAPACTRRQLWPSSRLGHNSTTPMEQFRRQPQSSGRVQRRYGSGARCDAELSGGRARGG